MSKRFLRISGGAGALTGLAPRAPAMKRRFFTLPCLWCNRNLLPSPHLSRNNRHWPAKMDHYQHASIERRERPVQQEPETAQVHARPGLQVLVMIVLLSHHDQ